MLAHEYLHPLSTNHATVSGDRQSNNPRVGERTRYSRTQNHVYAHIQVLISLRKPRLGIDLRFASNKFLVEQPQNHPLQGHNRRDHRHCCGEEISIHKRVSSQLSPWTYRQ